MSAVLISQIFSTLVYILIIYGVTQNKQREKHMKIMKLCFGLDIANVLYIEFGKDAVAQAVGFPDGLLGFHIIVSVMSVILYVVLLVTGSKLNSGTGGRSIHKQMAYAFLIFRTTNLITSYML